MIIDSLIEHSFNPKKYTIFIKDNTKMDHGFTMYFMIKILSIFFTYNYCFVTIFKKLRMKNNHLNSFLTYKMSSNNGSDSNEISKI